MPRHDPREFLKSVDLFRNMSHTDIRRMERGATRRHVHRSEVLYRPGEPGDRLYVLERGVVRLSSLVSGRELTLALLGKGEFFGEEALLGGVPRDYTAEAYEDARLYVVLRPSLVALRRRRPEVFFGLVRRVGQRLHTLCERVERLLFKGASGRLARTLLDLAQRHGVADEDGVTLALGLSQGDLAKLIGVSRESVNAALADLRRRGLVTVDAGRLRLLDMAGLDAVQ